MLKDTLLENIKGDTVLKKQAKQVFEDLGFPTVKNEEWKYTNLLKWTKSEFNVQDSIFKIENIEEYIIDDSFDRIVLVNGLIDKSLTKVSDVVEVRSLKSALIDNEIAQNHYGQYVDFSKESMYALNTAISNDGLFIHVAKSKVSETPIQIIHLSTAKENVFNHPRILTVVEENAQIDIIESFNSVSNDLVWNNAISEIYVAKNAILNWTKIQNDKTVDTALVDSTFIHQEKDSVSNVFTFSLGGKLTRNNLNFRLNDEHIEANLSAATLINEEQHVDHHTFVDHAFPNCESNENYKGIYDGKSKGVFNGKVLVRLDAQKTNAYQNNANVILSDQASVDTKPQLEIFADDVKCSHGCTVGHQEDEALFYMRQRGLSLAQAQGILNLAFVGEITDKLKNEKVKEYIVKLIEDKLN